MKKQGILKEEIYIKIKQHLLSGDYKPGDRLNIDILAKKFKVSNTPVREALSSLESDGFLEFIANSGFFVKHISEKDFHDADQAAFTLILGAYEICVRKNKIEELIQKLQLIVDYQIDLTNNAIDEEFLQTCWQFDSAFIELADNSCLKSSFNSLFNTIILSAYRYPKSLSEKDIVKEHRELLIAVKNRDSQLFKKLLWAHHDYTLD